jgi:hypothetical protein
MAPAISSLDMPSSDNIRHRNRNQSNHNSLHDDDEDGIDDPDTTTAAMSSSHNMNYHSPASFQDHSNQHGNSHKSSLQLVSYQGLEVTASRHHHHHHHHHSPRRQHDMWQTFMGVAGNVLEW